MFERFRAISYSFRALEPRLSSVHHTLGNPTDLLRCGGGELGIRCDFEDLKIACPCSLRSPRTLACKRASGTFATARPMSGFEPRLSSVHHTLGNPTDLLRCGGGELGIRTPERVMPVTRLAGEHLRPLGQLSTFDTCAYHHKMIRQKGTEHDTALCAIGKEQG